MFGAGCRRHVYTFIAGVAAAVWLVWSAFYNTESDVWIETSNDNCELTPNESMHPKCTQLSLLVSNQIDYVYGFVDQIFMVGEDLDTLSP